MTISNRSIEIAMTTADTLDVLTVIHIRFTGITTDIIRREGHPITIAMVQDAVNTSPIPIRRRMIDTKDNTVPIEAV